MTTLYITELVLDSPYSDYDLIVIENPTLEQITSAVKSLDWKRISYVELIAEWGHFNLIRCEQDRIELRFSASDHETLSWLVDPQYTLEDGEIDCFTAGGLTDSVPIMCSVPESQAIDALSYAFLHGALSSLHYWKRHEEIFGNYNAFSSDEIPF